MKLLYPFWTNTMSLPDTTAAISFLSLKTEFGDTAPVQLSEFYAGGSLVPISASGALGPVPSSGAISLNRFRITAPVLPFASNSWTTITPTNLFSASNIVGNENFLVAFNYSGLYRHYSTDQGLTWTLGNYVQPAGSESNRVYGYLPITSINNVLHAAVFTGFVKSTDQGATWQAQASFPAGSYAATSTTQSTIQNICTGTYYGNPLYVTMGPSSLPAAHTYRSTDLVTWTYSATTAGIPRGQTEVLFIPSLSAAGGLFLIPPIKVSTAVHKAFYSEDAITWTKADVYDQSNTVVNEYSKATAYCVHNGEFVGFTSTGKRLRFTGTKFTVDSAVSLPVSTTVTETYNILVETCGWYLLAIYASSTDNLYKVAVSVDGETWTLKNNTPISSLTSPVLKCFGNYWHVKASTGIIYRAPI